MVISSQVLPAVQSPSNKVGISSTAPGNLLIFDIKGDYSDNAFDTIFSFTDGFSDRWHNPKFSATFIRWVDAATGVDLCHLE